MERNFENCLVTYCAPTLAGIKAGSIFNFRSEGGAEQRQLISRWSDVLFLKGVDVTVLNDHAQSTMIYVYRPSALAQALRNRETSSFLSRSGYAGCHSQDDYLRVLRRRLSDNAHFPHEIGVFLGYPLQDVIGFIKNRGRNFRCCGFWKVYGEKSAADRRFHELKMCTSIYKALYSNGQSVVQLTVDARYNRTERKSI